MISTSTSFKNSVRSDSKQVRAYVTDGVNPVTGADDLKSFKISADGGLCRTTMRQLNFSHWSDTDFLDSEVNAGWGVASAETTSLGAVTLSIATPCIVTLEDHGLLTGDKINITTTGALPTGLSAGDYYVISIYDGDDLDVDTFSLATTYANAIAGTKIATSGSQSGVHSISTYTGGFSSTYEDIDYGTFKVIEVEVDMASGLKKCKAFDKMYDSLQIYSLSLEYPKTVLELLQAICTELSWTLATTDFLNYDLSLDAEKFTREQTTYRQVLDQIAQLSGTIMYFNVDDELVLKPFPATVEENITPNDMKTLKFESKWGGLNSLTLARTPQEDNINQQDAVDIAANGLWEFRIENNQILDGDRETYIGDIYTALEGIEYYPFESKTIGLGFLEVGDYLEVTDLDDSDKNVFLTSVEIEIGSGIIETIKSEMPVQSPTNYQYAGIIGQTIKNTEIIVNKQEGEIELLVDDTTQIKQTAESIQLTAQTALDNSETNADGISTLESDVASLEVRADGLDIAVTQAGGSNLLKNSTGLKGTLEEWVEVTSFGDTEIEDFSDGIGFWEESVWNNANATVSGSCSVAFDLTAEDGYFGLERAVNMEGGAISLKISQFNSGNIGTNFHGVGIYLADPVGWDYYMKFFVGNNGDSIRLQVDGYDWRREAGDNKFIDAYDFNFDVDTYNYLRIRIEEEVFFFEISTNGVSWEIFAQSNRPDNVFFNDTIVFVDVEASTDTTYQTTLAFDDLTLWGNATSGNGGTIDQSSEVAMNTESGSGINITGQYIQQVVSTIPNETYTFFTRFKKAGTVYIDITGQEQQELTIADYTDEDWGVYKYQFTATSENTTLKIDATAVDSYALMCDMVLKLGDATGWVQAPNEVYGSNFRFDKDGFSITSQTDTFKSVLDNTKLAVYDTSPGGNRAVMVVSKDSGKISSLVAQETFSVQRYENPASRIRFIPTSTGCMVVVND